jgi:hypothetical protein
LESRVWWRDKTAFGRDAGVLSDAPLAGAATLHDDDDGERGNGGGEAPDRDHTDPSFLALPNRGGRPAR